MKKDELVEDEFLRELLRTSPLESPSVNFVDRVMAGIQAVPAEEKAARTMISYLKSALPYIGLAAFVMLFFFSSDLPVGKYMPAQDYFSKFFLPYFSSLVGGFKTLFASRFVTFAMGIALSAGFLVLIEHFFSRRSSINHPMI